MRFAARSKHLVLVSLFAMPVYADTNNCASPPGPLGTIRCEKDQIAICEATGSRVNGQCLDKGGRTGKELAARVLSAVFRQQISANVVEQEQYQRLLREKRVVTADGVVTFSYEGIEESIPPPPPSDHPDESPSLMCTACVTVKDERICEAGTATSKEEATRVATEALRKQLSARFGFGIASELGDPSILCESDSEGRL